MTHEIRQRIIRPAPPEEKQRHQQVRQQIEAERTELEQWAREVAERHTDRVAVGTVFTAEEAEAVEAIDNYAKHALANRGAVVREAAATPGSAHREVLTCSGHPVSLLRPSKVQQRVRAAAWDASTRR